MDDIINCIVTQNVQHPNLNIIIIGFGFNFLTALSPIILIFLTQAVAPERAQARIDSIKKDRAIINEKFSSMHSLSTSIEDQPKRLMKSIASFLKLKWVYISSWVILFLTAIGVAVQVLKYFGAFRIQGRLLSSVTVITYASAATSLIIAVAYILFRKFYELFIYNPWVRSCVLLTLFLQALQLEFILIIPAHYFSVKITASKNWRDDTFLFNNNNIHPNDSNINFIYCFQIYPLERGSPAEIQVCSGTVQPTQSRGRLFE